MLGVMYLVGLGNPFFVSIVFRFINALAILPIFWLTNKLFDKRSAYIASIIYAVSFEATQYSIYIGNPSLAIWSWIALFAGAVIIYKSKNKFWGLPLMALGIASGIQFQLFLLILIPVGVVILLILKQSLVRIGFKSWLFAISLGLGLCSTYILAEIKNGFRSVGLMLHASANSSFDIGYRWATYVRRWLLMLHDNVFPMSPRTLLIFGVLVIGFLLYQARSNKPKNYLLMLVWVLSGIILTMLGSYDRYYVNVGIGVGMVIVVANVIDKIFSFNKVIGVIIVTLVVAGNLTQVVRQSKEGLIEDIKTQTHMLLDDQIKVIDKMYEWSGGQSFTVRVTSMPYKVQTVWAYLFNWYGKQKYGYLPYYQTGNTLGFEGNLPEPKDGTTCVRYLLKEPSGGIPKELFEEDEREENLFSKVVETTRVGGFVLESRVSTDKVCKKDNFPSL
jgi:hypothetical protein